MVIELLIAGLLSQGPSQAPRAPATPADAVPPSPALSELHQAQVEAHLLRVKTLQLEVQLQQMVLSEQRTKLEAAIVADHPGWTMNWEKGVLVPTPPKGTQP